MLLMDAGCDVGLRNEEGLTALEVAEQLECDEVVAALRANGQS
jgi:hypothetical protein